MTTSNVQLLIDKLFSSLEIPEVLDVRKYKTFKKVCDVISVDNSWSYKNINKELMFSPHRSWVYFIVDGNTIVKVGETGKPLGIEDSNGQPRSGTDNRLGRYRNGDGTDFDIRSALKASVLRGTVSIWAHYCLIELKKENEVFKEGIVLEKKYQKELEEAIIANIKAVTGKKPALNKNSK